MPIMVPVFEEPVEGVAVADGDEVVVGREELMAEFVGGGVIEELGVGEGVDGDGCDDDESSEEVVEASDVEVVFDEASSVVLEDSADEVVFSVEDESSEPEDVE